MTQGTLPSPRVVVLLWKSTRVVSGVMSVSLRLKEALSASGMDSRIVLCNPHPDPEKRGRPDHVVLHPGELAQWLDSIAPAILVVLCERQFVQPMLAVAKLKAKGAEIQIWADVHADSERDYYRWVPVFSPYVDRFLCVSTRIRDQVRRRLYDYPDQRIHFLPRGVAPRPFPQREKDNRRIRLIYTGRLEEPQKRVRLYPRLLQRLDDLGVEYQMDFAGEGPEEQWLRNALSKEIRQGRVSFLGPRTLPQVESDYARSDVVVNLSAYEGLSQTMLEGMATGCVPVMTEVSGVRDVIRDGVNGFIVPVEEPLRAAEILARLADESELRTRVGREAWRTIRQEMNVQSTCEQFQRILGESLREEQGSLPRLGLGNRLGLEVQAAYFRLRFLASRMLGNP